MPSQSFTPSPVSVTRSDWDGLSAPSLPEVFRSIPVPSGARFWRKIGAFTGPGYLIAVGYIDPGNWATDLAGGARYGYALLSVIILSSLLAVFLQTLSLRLGIATGRDLAQLSRERFSIPVATGLWIGCELAIIACDLAEVIGAAVALQLLFGLPLIAGVCLTAADVFLVLWLQSRGFRYIEALVMALLCAIAACFAMEMVIASPDLAGISAAILPSRQIVADPGMLYLAIGILGATVMPHNLYLHSSIAQTRNYAVDQRGKREAIRFATIDSTTALIAALFINAAILILATAFNRAGYTDVSEIQDAYRLLTPVLGGGLASLLFGLALLAAGQNSSVTGTLAGQIVMEGFMRRSLSPGLRRLVTRGLAILPAVVVIGICGESSAGRLLILSQVVLSLQLSFAVVPLLMFTGDARLMGSFANRRCVRLIGWVCAVAIAGANAWLVWTTLA
ncbi:MAG: Nramp family divalent metal transporter [Alphaproteobacteria bacterium]|nr:Nramp family divalent metal transporter [Alphaproteobacteria bacterium]